jgi:hypothetical protein
MTKPFHFRQSTLSGGRSRIYTDRPVGETIREFLTTLLVKRYHASLPSNQIRLIT